MLSRLKSFLTVTLRDILQAKKERRMLVISVPEEYPAVTGNIFALYDELKKIAEEALHREGLRGRLEPIFGSIRLKCDRRNGHKECIVMATFEAYEGGKPVGSVATVATLIDDKVLTDIKVSVPPNTALKLFKG